MRDPGAEGFRRLSPDQQAAVRRVGDVVGARVSSHAVQILIGRRAAAPEQGTINHASGVVVLLGARRMLVTAWHVIAGYVQRRQAGEDVAFQVGNARLPVETRVLWRHVEDDLAFVLLAEEDHGCVPAQTWLPDRWPPTLPVAGEYVAFAGYPTEYRQTLGPGRVDLGLIGGMLRVSSASRQRAVAVMERESLVATRGPHVPPPGAQLGGMSGGPVFRVEDTVNGPCVELVGVITDYGENFDTFLLGLFGSEDLAGISGITEPMSV